MERFTGLIGIVVILAIAFLFSNNKKAINYRLVASGLALQVSLALLVLKVPPVKSFFQTLGEGMKAIELEKFAQAGKMCADALNTNKKVVTTLIGHFMVDQTRMHGYPAIFTVKANEYGKDYLRGTMTEGDVYLHVGYSYTPVDELTVARESGAKTIAVFTPGPTTVGEGSPVEPDKSMVDIYIDPYWKHGDSVVEVPGYDVKVMPVSGVVMVTSYWMILGETMKNMKAGN